MSHMSVIGETFESAEGNCFQLLNSNWCLKGDKMAFLAIPTWLPNVLILTGVILQLLAHLP